MADYAFELRREDRFSYVCNRCSRCCYGKRIPLSPYDLVRLAEAKGISTGELIREHTEEGVYLRVRREEPGQPCVFLGPEGCTVHSGRPAPCRMYPLGRTAGPSGVEAFCHLEPHPQTAGEYGKSGTIADYLESQGLAPYIAATEAYNRLFEEIAEVFALVSHRAETNEEAPPEDSEHVLDVDAWVERYCEAHGLAAPQSTEAKVALHIAAVREWLADLRGRAVRDAGFPG